MNKSELIVNVANCSGLTIDEAYRAIECYHRTVIKAVKNGESVKILGFGSFNVAVRSARKIYSLQIKEKVYIAAKKVVKFKPGKRLELDSKK